MDREKFRCFLAERKAEYCKRFPFLTERQVVAKLRRIWNSQNTPGSGVVERNDVSGSTGHLTRNTTLTKQSKVKIEARGLDGARSNRGPKADNENVVLCKTTTNTINSVSSKLDGCLSTPSPPPPPPESVSSSCYDFPLTDSPPQSGSVTSPWLQVHKGQSHIAKIPTSKLRKGAHVKLSISDDDKENVMMVASIKTNTAASTHRMTLRSSSSQQQREAVAHSQGEVVVCGEDSCKEGDEKCGSNHTSRGEMPGVSCIPQHNMGSHNVIAPGHFHKGGDVITMTSNLGNSPTDKTVTLSRSSAAQVKSVHFGGEELKLFTPDESILPSGTHTDSLVVNSSYGNKHALQDLLQSPIENTVEPTAKMLLPRSSNVVSAKNAIPRGCDVDSSIPTGSKLLGNVGSGCIPSVDLLVRFNGDSESVVLEEHLPNVENGGMYDQQADTARASGENLLENVNPRTRGRKRGGLSKRAKARRGRRSESKQANKQESGSELCKEAETVSKKKKQLREESVPSPMPVRVTRRTAALQNCVEVEQGKAAVETEELDSNQPTETITTGDSGKTSTPPEQCGDSDSIPNQSPTQPNTTNPPAVLSPVHVDPLCDMFLPLTPERQKYGFFKDVTSYYENVPTERRVFQSASSTTSRENTYCMFDNELDIFM